MAKMNATANASRALREDPDGFRLWQTPKGDFWLPKGDNTLLASLLTEQENRIYGVGRNGVRAGDIVLDCGAHVGVFTREALAAGAKLVVAIEPSPDNLVALRRNVAEAIDAGRVIVSEKGVWDSETSLQFYLDPDNSAGSAVVSSSQAGQHIVRIAVTTIDRLVAELQLERVDFIKMDIEGAESRALAGARNTLANHKPRLATAAYHEPDDQIRIPVLVRSARPDYQMQCGPCGEKDFRILPHTLLFH